MIEQSIQKSRLIHFKALDIGASVDTSAQEYHVRIDKPYSQQSVVRPESVNLQVLAWENPKPERPPTLDQHAHIQLVVIGGFAINAVELGSEITELLKYSNKIVGIAHPDAPQSNISPKTSPFNDLSTFQNSGIAIHATIKKLIHKGILDEHHPISIVGFSTGAAVATEAVARDITQHETSGDKRLITNLVALVAPAGLHKYDSVKELRNLAIASGPKYMSAFVEDVARRKDYKQALLDPKATLEHFDPSANPDSYLNKVKRMKPPQKVLFLLRNILETTKNPITNPIVWIKQTIDAGKRLFRNIRAMKKEFLTDSVWMKIAVPHILFELGEFAARSVPSEELTNLLWHFHVMWKDQGPQGEPHFTPETPAVKRSEYNLANLAGLAASAKIHDTDVLVMLGVSDPVVDLKRLLRPDEIAQLQQLEGSSDYDVFLKERIASQVQHAFPNAGGNVKTNLMTGPDSHHLGFRRHAAHTARTILEACYPQPTSSGSFV